MFCESMQHLPALLPYADLLYTDHSLSLQIIRDELMAMHLKINYIELPARDLGATQRFYERAFSWSFTDYGQDYRAFSDGALDGGFYRSQQSSNSTQGAALVVLYTDAIDIAHKAVISAGGTISKEIFSFPGGRRFHFSDPNGNELAIWSDK